MSTPPRPVKVICPGCRFPYKDWLRHVNPRLDTFDQAYLEACSSVVCPHCSLKLASDDFTLHDELENAASVVRPEGGLQVESWEGERWSWSPRQPSPRPNKPENDAWLWFFGSQTECHRWRYDTWEVPGSAPSGSSTSFARAIRQRSSWSWDAVYVALARRWEDTADDGNREPLYTVVADEDVTLVLADFCTALLQEKCERTGLVLRNHPALYEQTFLALSGFLLTREVAALRRKLRRTVRYTEPQKVVLTRWCSLLKYRRDLLEGTFLLVLFYLHIVEELHYDGEGGLEPFTQTPAEVLARLESSLLDELGIQVS